MLITVLEQGLTNSSPNAVGNILISALNSEKFNKFYAFSAFASKAGINGLKSTIQSAVSNGMAVNIIVGIDQKGTSKAALKAIGSLNVNSFIFYQRSPSIYHPKMYLFEGQDESQLIVGSSNLTSQGLFRNIETSVLINLDNGVQSDIDFIKDLKNTYSTLFSFSDPNLQKITNNLINDLVKAGIVPTEKQRKANHSKSKSSIVQSAKSLISSLFPSRSLSNIPLAFQGKKKRKKSQTASTSSQTPTIFAAKETNVIGNLAWSRASLPASSVEASPGGNPTGGLRLVQAKFSVAGSIIDQTTYFRKTVFKNYTWVPSGSSEIAVVNFDLKILGKARGTFSLDVRHKPSGEAGQGNYTTLISWGDAGDEIKKTNLTGKRLNLYYPSSSGNNFLIEII